MCACVRVHVCDHPQGYKLHPHDIKCSAVAVNEYFHTVFSQFVVSYNAACFTREEFL